MNIYFHIDELNRDAVVASALKSIFKENGHNLVYGNRVSNRLLNYFHDAFDIIVVPRPHFLYDNWGDKWLGWDSKIVTLSSESLGIICKDHQVMARTLLEKDFFQGNKEYVNRIDAFCLWGGKQLQAVKDYANDVYSRCHVIGHPRHDSLCLKASVKVDNETRRKKIGVITRASVLNDYFGRSALNTYSTLFDDHFQYEIINPKSGLKVKSMRPGVRPADMVVVQGIDAENTLKVIKSLEENGYAVSLRTHPKENADEWRALLSKSHLKAVLADSREPVTHWLTGFDYILGPPSTCFYDAIMLGVTPISICGLDERRRMSIDELWEDNNRLMEYVYRPASISDLVGYVKSGDTYITGEGVRRVLKEEADYPECRNALRKFSEICVNLHDLEKNRFLKLIAFNYARSIFNIAWRIRNLFIKRKENSAMFALTKKVSRFIDDLVD